MQATLPLTPGRELGPVTPWNFWIDGTVTGGRDRRYGLNTENNARALSMGVDRKVRDNTAVGVSVTLQRSWTSGFGNVIRSESDGLTVGPYVAVQLSPQWVVDGSVTYSNSTNDTRILSLSGRYTSQQVSASLNVHSQYLVDGVDVRPTVSVFYSHIRSDAYDMTGQLLGRSIATRFPNSTANYGVLEASLELSKLFILSNHTPVMPYVEVGAQYEFERPGGGQVLTARLDYVTPAPTSASVRGGVRMLLPGAVLFEASGGYLSLGHSDLDEWEGRLYLSFAF